MDIRTNKAAFVEAVSAASRYAATKGSDPALTGILVEVSENELRISGYNQETAVRYRVPATTADVGELVFPGKTLADIVRVLRSDEIHISAVKDIATVTGGTSVFTVSLIKATSYPKIPALPEVIGTIPGALLQSVASQVGVATNDKDESAPLLGAINIRATKDKLIFAATDRYRLAIREIAWNGGIDEDRVLNVPAKRLSEAGRMFSAVSSVSVASEQATSSVGFASADKVLLTLQTGGDFPKYESLLPDSFVSTATVSRSELLNAARAVSSIATEQAPLKLTFTSDLVVIVSGEGTDAAGRDEVAGNLDGEDITISFNPAFLLDGLNALEGEKVIFSMNTDSKPAVLTSEVEGFRYLLMPVRPV